MGSAALLALFGDWDTQSELHAFIVLCSAFLPSLTNLMRTCAASHHVAPF